MDIDEVVVLNRLDCGFRFSRVVGVQIARRAFHGDDVHAGACGDAGDDVNRGDDGGGAAVVFAGEAGE